jgi:hypothetical protein
MDYCILNYWPWVLLKLKKQLSIPTFYNLLQYLLSKEVFYA